MNRNYLKPVIAGVIAGSLDNIFLKQTNIKSNMFFGASVAIGSWVSSILAPTIVSVVPQIGGTSLMNTKTLGVRISEIGLGLGASWGVNKYILSNDFNINSSERNKQIGVIALSDFVAEYVQDFISGSELNYLTADIN